ncbi:MAG: hypothetical protein ACPGWM_08995, partial [Flavobacteriales bacterium]
WVGRNLFKNGEVFLKEVYEGQPEFAESVNKLLLIGFYLLNFGFIVYALKYKGGLFNFRDVFEASSRQLGRIILILGTLHFINLMVFFNLKKKVDHRKNTSTQLNA